MKIGTLLLRGTIGSFFVGHGAQKLFGAYGGGGLSGTAEMFESIGMRPGVAQAALAGASEMAGGAGLVLGYRTPLSASTVVATMTVAIQKVHGRNGWNIQAHGYEYNAVLIAAALAVAEQGPGALSLDALRGKQHKGVLAMLFALGAGVAGAQAAQAASNYFGPPAGDVVVESPAEPESAADAEAGVAPVSDAVIVEVAEIVESGETPLPIEPLEG